MHQPYCWGASAKPAHTHRPPARWGRLLAVLALLLSSTGAWAQLTGTKTIPGSYATLAAAITDLNAQGVGSGGVTFNIAAGYAETFASPTAGAITATGTSANPIVFQKAGTGANPLITAGTGTTTGLDAIISLAGSDYVTFNGIDVAENSANTTATAQMEFGYALFRPSATDGCQYNTIRNCVVTLNKTNVGTIGIAGLASPAGSTTTAAASATSGANTGNKIYGNVVTNALTGINFAASSSTTTANYDQSNEIGSTTAGTANVIGNFGGTASGWGAGGSYQNGLRIIGNTINSTLNYTSATASTSVAASTVTSTLRGIYCNAGASNNLDVTSNAVTLASGATTSSLYGMESSAGTTATGTVINLTNNTFALSYLTATSGAVYGLNNSGSPATLNITGNTVSSINTSTTGSTYGIYNNHSATAANVLNNTVTGITRTGTSGAVYGYYNNGSGAGTHTLTSNVFTSFTLATSGSVYGIYNTSAAGETQLYSANQITSITSSSTASLYGINCTYGASGSQIFNNTITGLSSTGTAAYGLNLTNTSFTQVAAYGNVVGGISLSGSAATVYGIYTSVTTADYYRNKFYDLSATGSGASVVYGLYTAGGTTIQVYNNLIGNLTAPASTSLNAVAGLYLSSGTTINAYYNTIYLNASSTGATFGTSGLYFSSTPTTVDVRNNVVVNTSTPAGTGGYTAALRRSTGTTGTVPANFATTSNNNLYYAGTPSATNLIYVEGTTTATNPQQTLLAFKAFMTNRGQASVTENPPFASTTGTATNFLHITPGATTQIESGAQAISSITTDYDGDTRSATPDIGADEGSFVAQDLTGPTITYTPLGATGSTGDRTLTVTITDASGVSTSTSPRLFYRKGTSGTFTSALPSSTSGSSYTFTISAAALGGLAGGNVVQYYVVAQDVPGNVSSSPAGGTFSTAPANVNQYLIQSVLSGTYYVGSGTSPDATRTYATLTAAATAYNSNSLGGAVTFLLLDATYSTAETFPVIFGNNTDASATNTLTIRPNTGVTSAITGSNATAILALNGADYVTLDGSNGGTLSATDSRPSRNLTVTNTNTATTSFVVLVTVPSATDNATNNTVKNLVAVGSGAAATQVGIALLSSTSGTAGNNNNLVQNNAVQAVQYGIYSYGTSATVKNTGTVLTQNDLNATGTSAIGRVGIAVGFEDGIQITRNQIDGIIYSGSGDVAGISVGFGLTYSATNFTGSEVTNATISRNNVGVVRETGTYSAVGIGLAAAASGTSTIVNNFVSGVAANGTGGDFGAGIYVGGGTGSTTRVLYNSVSMTNPSPALTGGNYPGFALAIGGSTPTVEIRNNILANTQSTGSGNSVALGLAYSSTTGAYVGLTSTNNDLYVSSGSTFAVGQTGGLGTGGTLRSTLAALNAETGQDSPSTSKSVDPVFLSATDLHVTGAAVNNAGVPIAGITVDYDGDTRSTTTPDIGADEFTPPSCQPATGLAVSGITATGATLTFTAPTSGSTATSYTVTYTPAGGTATTVTPSPTGTTVTLTGLTASTTYTATVTTNCGSTTSPSTTVTFTTTCAAPVYAALPITEGFENTWINRCDVREVPSNSWLNTPVTGNPSWRRDDDGAAANWTSPTNGAYTPAGSQGSSHSARFHAYYATSGAVGTLDLYANLSSAGTKRLTFDYVNNSTAGSKLDVLLSTDGGATFSTTPLLSLTTATSFTAQTVDLTSTSATAVIRFQATSDFGNYDLGLDNVQVRGLSSVDLAAASLATPTATQGCYGSAETVSVVVSNPGSGAINFATNPATVTAVVTTPSGSQTLTGSITTGTLAAGATQTVTLAPTLNMTAVGTYSFAITATVTGDGNTANDLLTPAPTRTVTAPVAGTLAPASTTICVSGTATLTLTGSANGTIQFQSSTDGTTFTDISGATTSPYTTAVLTATTYFRAQVRCNSGVATSNVSTITVNNPRLTANNGPVAICSGSTATITATPATGSQVRFFSAATGGTALTTTTAGSYTTPALTASTTYYAEAYSGGSEVVGKATSNQTNGGYSGTGTGLVFTTTGPLTLQSATVYNATATAGSMSVDLVNNTSGAVITTVGPFTIPAGSTTTLIPTVLTLNLAVPAAGTYRLVTSSTPTPPTLYRDSGTNNSFPYTSPSGQLSITSGYISGTSTSYYFFYNIQISNECVAASRTAIQVNVTQPATATFPNATVATCGTTPYQLAGTVGGSATTGTYTSSGTGTFSPNATTLGATYTPSAADVTAGSVTITLTAPAAGGCPAASATLALTISTTPAATFSYAPAAGCAGSAGTASPTLGAGASAGTFTASPAGLTINATTGVITLSSSAAGTYTVTNSLAANGGCTAATATTTYTVNAAPATPTITVTGTPATGITLTSSATTGNQFFRNGTAIAGATGQSYIVLSGAGNGNYTVTTTNAAGCSATSAAVAITVTGTTPAQGTQLTLHPNPTPTGQVTLELTGYRLATELTVLDAVGRVVLSRQLPANTGTATYQLDLSNSASGVYVLRLRNADGVETRRLTRE